MFSLTSHAPGLYRRRDVRAHVASLLTTLLLASTGCSGSGEHQVATLIMREAGPPDAPPKCEPESHTVTDMGIDVYFLLDHSESFRSEWETVSGWLISLAYLDEFAGVGAGLVTTPVFEQPDPACVEACGVTLQNCNCLERCNHCNPISNGRACVCVPDSEDCSQDAYVTPNIEIRPLPDIQPALPMMLFIKLGVPDHGWTTFPPLLSGSLAYRDRWEQKNSGRRITQVMIASTLSGACDNHTPDPTSDLEKVLAGAGKTKTYVIGVNVNSNEIDDFNRVAKAGQTASSGPLMVKFGPGGPPLTNPLPDLMRRIRGAEGRCEYLLPTASPDFDPTKVNLTVSGQNPSSFVQVRDRASCNSSTMGWFYDDQQHPTRILTCENTCAAIHQRQTGSADLQLGCPTATALDAGPP